MAAQSQSQWSDLITSSKVGVAEEGYDTAAQIAEELGISKRRVLVHLKRLILSGAADMKRFCDQSDGTMKPHYKRIYETPKKRKR